MSVFRISTQMKRSRKPSADLNPFILVSIRYQGLLTTKFLPTIRTTDTQLQFPVTRGDMGRKCCHYNPYHPGSKVLLGRTNKRAAAKGHISVASLVANPTPSRWLEEPGFTAPNGRNSMTSFDVGCHNLWLCFSGHVEFAIDTFSWRIEPKCLVDDVSCGYGTGTWPAFLKACLGRVSKKVAKDLFPFNLDPLTKCHLDKTE